MLSMLTPGVLEFQYHFSRLYINEVAMCMPYANTNRESNPVSEDNQPLHGFPSHGPAFSEFLEPVDSSFRVFTTLDMSAIRSFPSMHLLRMIYTVIILVKLHFAAVQVAGQEAQQQLERVNVSARLDSIIQMFVGWGTLWPAPKLTSAFSQIRAWFEKCKDGRGHATMQEQDQEESEFALWPVNPSTVNPDDVGSLDLSQDNTTTSISSDGPLGSNLASISWNGPLGSDPMGDATLFTLDSVLGLDIPTNFALSDKHDNDPFANYSINE